jgi:hypothetical protein
MMPLVALNHLLFCHVTIVAEDVISVLKPKYDDCADNSASKRVLREFKESNEQRAKKEGVLVELLRDAQEDADFLRDFVWFATAYEYLPRSNFEINVEFDSNCGSTSLPSAHTCVAVMVLPNQAYDANKEELRKKLCQSFADTRKTRFDMR